jgi:integrase/recombinase XerD
MNTNISLTQATKDFSENLKTSGRATATVLAYTKDIDQLVEFLNKDNKLKIGQVNQQDIVAFKENLRSKNYTAKSISRKINSIKSFFKYLTYQGKIEKNPAEQIEHPKYEITPPRILTQMEYRALRDACKDDSRMSAVIELLLQTGMRISEVANLTTDNLDFKNNSIVLEEHDTHPGRTVPMNNPIKAILQKYIEERPRCKVRQLFVTKTCNPFLVRNIRSSIDRFFRLAGIKNAKVNDLRHTFIAHQLSCGAPLTYISQMAGHKRLSTTEKYLQFIDNKKDGNKNRLFDL